MTEPNWHGWPPQIWNGGKWVYVENDLGIPDFLKVENRAKPLGATESKPLVYSYTFLNCYDDVCPYQAYRTYIKKDIPYVETPERKRGNLAHDAFDKRVGAGKPLPAEMQQWEPLARAFDGRKPETELKLAVDRQAKPVDYWAKTGVYVRGRLDCVVAQEPRAFMADWKTGGSKYEKPFELEVGAMLLRACRPQIKIVAGSYVWLAENRVGKSYDLSDARKTWERVNEIASRIEHDYRTGQFEKRQGPLCGWCSVYDCEYNKNTKHR